ERGGRGPRRRGAGEEGRGSLGSTRGGRKSSGRSSAGRGASGPPWSPLVPPGVRAPPRNHWSCSARRWSRHCLRHRHAAISAANHKGGKDGAFEQSEEGTRRKEKAQAGDGDDSDAQQ